MPHRTCFQRLLNSGMLAEEPATKSASRIFFSMEKMVQFSFLDLSAGVVSRCPTAYSQRGNAGKGK